MKRHFVLWTVLVVAPRLLKGSSTTTPALLPPFASGQDGCGSLSTWAIRNDAPPPFHGADSIQIRRKYWETMTKARINEIAYAAERWCRARGRYPASLRQLLDYAKRLPPRAPCRFFPELLIDPWEHKVRYKLVQGVPTITSPGPDGTLDTGDDIGLPSVTDSAAQPIEGELCK